MDTRLFGTAGLRGTTNSGISAELALRLARAYGDWLHRHDRKHGSVSVGHDTRWGAAMLARAAASGFASAGFHVQFYGVVPTGAFALNTARTHQDGGLLVTGSHMPPDRIGLLLLDREGALCPFTTTDAVEALLREEDPRDVPPREIGRLEEAFHPYELYVSECMQAVDAALCRKRKYKVVVDPANGASCEIANEFFQWLGCQVEMLHFDPNPVPDRPSEPRAHTVGAAIELVKREKADLGICFDVDADRVLFIDHTGRPVSEDTVGALFAKHVLKPGDVCVAAVNSSGLIERVCRETGARLEYSKVGQPHEVAALRAHGGRFCYEESGKYYFPPFLWADGLFSGARLLEIMARENKPLAELAAPFPTYHQVKRNVAVPDDRKTPAMEAVEKRLRTELADGLVRDVTVDGLKRVYADDSWLLLRASGTEPLVRVYTDAPTENRATALADAGEALLKECL